MFCKNCGSALPDGAKFCSSCGTPVAVQQAAEAFVQTGQSVSGIAADGAAAAAAADNAVDAVGNEVEELVSDPGSAGVSVQEIVSDTQETVPPAQQFVPSVQEFAPPVQEFAPDFHSAAEETVENAAQTVDETLSQFAGPATEAAENFTAEAEELAGMQTPAPGDLQNDFDVVTEPVYADKNENAAFPACSQPYAQYNQEQPQPQQPPSCPPQQPVPPQPQNYAVPEQKKQVKERAPHKRSAIAHVGTVIICLFLFAFLVATICVAAARSVITESFINGAIEKMHLENMKVDDVFDLSTIKGHGLEVKDGDTVIDFIYDNIDKSALSSDLTREQFREIATSDEVRDFIAATVSRRAASIVDDIRTDVINIDEIMGFVTDNREYLESVTKSRITDSDIANLRETLNDTYGEVLRDLEIPPLSEQIGEGAMTAIRIVTSTWLLIVLIVIDVLLVLLVFLVIRSWRFGLLYNGVTFIVAGLPFVLAAAALSLGIITFESGDALIKSLLLGLGAFSKTLFICGGIVAVAGIIMVVASCIVRSVQKKKSAKRAAA